MGLEPRRSAESRMTICGLQTTLTIDTLIPILYLKGVSTGDFVQAMAALLGKDATGLTATASRG
jgi:hypothetical protein